MVQIGGIGDWHRVQYWKQLQQKFKVMTGPTLNTGQTVTTDRRSELITGKFLVCTEMRLFSVRGHNPVGHCKEVCHYENLVELRVPFDLRKAVFQNPIQTVL